MIDDDLYGPMPTLAKIGNRYYWAIYRHKRPDETDGPSTVRFDRGGGWLPIDMLRDGFTDTREAAADDDIRCL